MKFKVDVDTDHLKEAARKLKDDPAAFERLKADPKGELAKLGVHIDDDLHNRVKAAVAKAGPASRRQGSSIHVDTP